MTNLRKPQQWSVQARVDMSADTVSKQLCPVTKEPMEIVRCYFRRADGTMEPSFVAVHRKSRVVLPLPNEKLTQLMANEGMFNGNQNSNSF